MHIDMITDDEDFLGLRETWDSLYEKDPEAQFFLSWTFLSTYIRRFEGGWFVLVVRPSEGAPCVALLPLRLRTRMNKQTGHFHNEINMAGNYAADCTGIVCAPEHADRAIPALAKHLKKMHWAKLHLENLRMSERRLRLFLKHLSDRNLTVREIRRINKIDNVDNGTCPVVTLQETWDDYLAANISSGTRQKMRRFLRRAETGEEFRITVADESTIERDLEILLQLWRKKWAERKGKRLASIMKSNRVLYRDGFKTGTLFLPVLWQRDRPIAALATFLDPVKKAMLQHMAIRDESVDVPSAGRVLHAYSIRYGIERGFRTYDFLRGNEPYKYSFGAKDSPLQCLVVQTVSGRNLGDRLDTRSVASVFREATALHAANDLAKAENAYRKILQVDPAHSRTLYVLGQLLTTKGDHWEAAKAYEALAAIAVSSVKAWTRLGLALQAINRHSEAVDAFRKALELNPGTSPAQRGLAECLIALQMAEKATHALSVLHRRSDNLTRPVARANAAMRLRELNLDERRYFILPDQVKSILPVRERSAS